MVDRLDNKASFIPNFFEDFFDRYVEEPMSGCWLWVASQTQAGYGNLTYQRSSFYAHRCSYEAENGKGSAACLIVRHRCDNPSCMNPGHLLGGTTQDNVADMHARGRARNAFGERVHTAKLSDADVIEIRRMARAGESIAQIRRLFPVKWDTVLLAATGQRWSHIPGAVDPLAIVKEQVAPPNLRGEQAPNSILTEAAVRDIRDRLSKGERGVDLSSEYGVKQVTISAIKSRRIWAHV